MLRYCFAFALAATVLLGCSDDKSKRVTGPDDSYPLATSADAAVANLISAYSERNFGEYEKLFDDDFVFYFAAVDIDVSPWGQGFWERADELGSAQQLLGGMEGLREDGGTQPAVQSVTLQLSPVSSTWADASGDGPEYSGTLKRTYTANMAIEYAAGSFISLVQGQQIFYVKPVMQGDEEVFRLFRWRDLGNPLGKRGAGTEAQSWGAIKAYYR